MTTPTTQDTGQLTTDTSAGRLPALAPGVELIGTYASSGFKDPPCLVRRGDGQMVQVPELLYLVAEAMQRGESADVAARRISEAFGRGLEAEDVHYLVEEKLNPLGLVATADGAVPELQQKLDPLLGLKFRTAVVPPRLVRAVTVVFRPLFFPLVAVAVLVGLGIMDGWLFFHHGVAQSMRQTLNQPWFILLALGLVILAAAFHESGHATACRYGGADPGAMGVGLYLAWPAFYTDVTDAYRLGKGGRLRTDFGGVYFNVIFMLGVWGMWSVTRFEPLLLIIVVLHVEILHQFLPFLRMDGYYMVADLVGVPDLFNRVGPILRSLVPWRRSDERATELKPWVRAAVSAWVLFVVPFLLFNLGLILLHLPRILATGWHAGDVQWARALQSFGHGKALMGVAGVVELLILTVPLVGVVLVLGRVGRRATVGSWQWSAGSPLRRSTVLMGGALLVTALAFSWWPRGEYKPIRPGERGTVQDATRAAAKTVTRGTPALIPVRSTSADRPATEPTTTVPGATTETRPSTTTTETPTTLFRRSTSTTSGSTATTSGGSTETTVG